MKELRIKKTTCISIKKHNNSRISYKIKKENTLFDSILKEANYQMNNLKNLIIKYLMIKITQILKL